MQRGLWVVNAVLGLAVVVFVFQFLAFPAEASDLKLARYKAPPDNVKEREDLRDLRTLALPVTGNVDRKAGPSTLTGIQLAGLLPESGVAILQIDALGEQVGAYVGEPVPGMENWTLARVGSEGAVFTDGSREVALQMSE